jgi:hypothetical protein
MYRSRNFTAVVLEGRGLTYAFDAIEPGVLSAEQYGRLSAGRGPRYVAPGEAPATAWSACGLGMPVADRVLLRWRSRSPVTPRVCGLPLWQFRDGTVGHSHIRHIRIVAARYVYPSDMRMRSYGRVGAAGSRRGLGPHRATAAPRCSRARQARHGRVRPDTTHGVWGSHRFAAKRQPLGDRGHQASTLRQRAARVLRYVWWSKRPFHGIRSI